jgi:hypothetical protein
MFDIMELSEDALRKVLPKVSIRMVSRLIACYPRAIGRTLLNVMSETMHPCTIEILKDEMESSQTPSLVQIREAEKEFLRTINEEKLLPLSEKVH